MCYHIYILRCADGSYYVGQTDDLRQRLEKHFSGNGPKYTATRLPVELAYSEKLPTRSAAMKRESQLKRWSRGKKEALVSGNPDLLRKLSQSREEC